MFMIIIISGTQYLPQTQTILDASAEYILTIKTEGGLTYKWREQIPHKMLSHIEKKHDYIIRAAGLIAVSVNKL